MKKVFLKKCQEVPCGDKLVNELRDYTVKTYRFENYYLEFHITIAKDSIDIAGLHSVWQKLDANVLFKDIFLAEPEVARACKN